MIVIIVSIFFIIAGIFTLRLEGMRNFKIVSLIIYASTIILEIPHLFLPDPTNVIDVIIHVVAGFSVLFAFTNILQIRRIRPKIFIAISLTVITIIIIEIIPIFIGLGFTSDSIEDIIFYLVGFAISIRIFVLFLNDAEYDMVFEKDRY